MDCPKFSIVIPTVNGCETLLKPCVESILENTDLGETEILVVANGSTDNTQAYLASQPTVRGFIYDKPLGFVGANNEGVKHARGEFLVLLNNDTLILPSAKNLWLEKLHAPFRDRNVGVTGPMKVFSPEAQKDFLIFFCVMIRRACWNDVGGLDPIFGSFGEDVDFCCKAEQKQWRIAQVPEQKLNFDGKMGIGDFPIYHKSHQTLGGTEGLDALIQKNLSILRERYSESRSVKQLYAKAVETPSDIQEHIPTLLKYAKGVEHITEFGTRTGVSTSAFLMAEPKTLVAYDLHRSGQVAELEQAAQEAGINFQFKECDVRSVEIAPTDILFLDTWHVYDQVRLELLQADKVRKYIILHDTETFGARGETQGHEGIGRAIAEFLQANSSWKLEQAFTNNNGLTVLSRCSPQRGYRRIEV